MAASWKTRSVPTVRSWTRSTSRRSPTTSSTLGSPRACKVRPPTADQVVQNADLRDAFGQQLVNDRRPDRAGPAGDQVVAPCRSVIIFSLQKCRNWWTSGQSQLGAVTRSPTVAAPAPTSRPLDAGFERVDRRARRAASGKTPGHGLQHRQHPQSGRTVGQRARRLLIASANSVTIADNASRSGNAGTVMSPSR